MHYPIERVSGWLRDIICSAARRTYSAPAEAKPKASYARYYAHPSYSSSCNIKRLARWACFLSLQLTIFQTPEPSQHVLHATALHTPFGSVSDSAGFGCSYTCRHAAPAHRHQSTHPLAQRYNHLEDRPEKCHCYLVRAITTGSLAPLTMDMTHSQASATWLRWLQGYSAARLSREG